MLKWLNLTFPMGKERESSIPIVEVFPLLSKKAPHFTPLRSRGAQQGNVYLDITIDFSHSKQILISHGGANEVRAKRESSLLNCLRF